MRDARGKSCNYIIYYRYQRGKNARGSRGEATREEVQGTDAVKKFSHS